MTGIRTWMKFHPNLWEFILFNVLSNVATVVNFVVVWFCTGFVFRSFSQTPFRFLIFNYTNVEQDMGLGGFLSFLTATALAQAVNFFVQKNFVFRSNAAFSQAVTPTLANVVNIVVQVAVSLSLIHISEPTRP